jgi:CheY-like chemotaxis protein
MRHRAEVLKAVAALARQGRDLVIADRVMPRFDGL